jgi:hypothetical protein
MVVEIQPRILSPNGWIFANHPMAFGHLGPQATTALEVQGFENTNPY